MTPRFHLAAILVLGAGAVVGQSPNLGYLFPAGGKQGTTVEILAGGQRLRGAKTALVTGEGVEVTVLDHYRLPRNLNGDQRRLLMGLMKERQEFLTGGAEKPASRKKAAPPRKPAKRADPKRSKDKKEEAKKEEPPPVKLPPHPLLQDIDKKSLRELEVVRRTFLQRSRNQLNPQISEQVGLRITIAPDAPPGDCSIRLVTPSGLTNPVCFQVGLLPEAREDEPNEPRENPKLPPMKVLSLPVVVNGQILPGDVDRIRFRARKGEPLVVEARARQLIPYLADAVPGWFQIVVSLFDEKGKEVAFADDFRFSPDPILRYAIPQDGIYELEVRDSIYRGREDFVYRIRIGRVPVITQMFPLGTRRGLVTKAMVRGWNLPAKVVTFDPGSEGGEVRQVSVSSKGWHSNFVPYAVDELPQMVEREPNNSATEPQGVKLPNVINGRILEPGDVDVFRFHGRAGQRVVAEVQARRLNSPLDSKLTLLDVRGCAVAWNDDHMEKDGHLHLGAGLLTHHADSYLEARLPAGGAYFLVLADAQGHGGAEYAYRLRLSAPQPRIRSWVTPSSVVGPVGGHAALRFHVDRQDGFEGPVEVELVEAPDGYRLHGARIPAGQDHVRATLESPPGKPGDPFELRFRARGLSKQRPVECVVAPADDRMQAFLWRHLVPAEQFLVMPRWGMGKAPSLSLEDSEPTRLVLGSTADVRIVASGGSLPGSLRLEARDAPPGISVVSTGMLSDGCLVTMRADPPAAEGLAGNLILEAWMQLPAKKGRKAPPPRMVGVFPPIPFVVTSP